MANIYSAVSSNSAVRFGRLVFYFWTSGFYLFGHPVLCILTSKRMVENNWEHSKMSKKVPFSSCAQEAHVRLTKKNEEKWKKSLLVSDWEWLPKAGWHPNAGCSFGILLFFVLFSTCTSRVHDDVLWKTLLRMTQNVLWKTLLRKCVYWIEPVSWCESCTPHSSKT